jgi:hypothetical protein
MSGFKVVSWYLNIFKFFRTVVRLFRYASPLYINIFATLKRTFQMYMVSLVPVQMMRFAGITAMLLVAGCSSQTAPPPSVQVVSTSPLPSPSPYFNVFRPAAYPQQFIGGSNIPQRFYNNGPNPAYVGQFVPILQHSFDISPDGSYSFRWAWW